MTAIALRTSARVCLRSSCFRLLLEDPELGTEPDDFLPSLAPEHNKQWASHVTASNAVAVPVPVACARTHAMRGRCVTNLPKLWEIRSGYSQYEGCNKARVALNNAPDVSRGKFQVPKIVNFTDKTSPWKQNVSGQCAKSTYTVFVNCLSRRITKNISTVVFRLRSHHSPSTSACRNSTNLSKSWIWVWRWSTSFSFIFAGFTI